MRLTHVTVIVGDHTRADNSLPMDLVIFISRLKNISVYLEIMEAGGGQNAIKKLREKNKTKNPHKK